MKSNHSEWQRLIAGARLARDERDAQAPYGFATRIAAQAAGTPRISATAWVFERMSLRALSVAALLVVAAVATNIAPIKRIIDEDAAALQDDTLVDFSVSPDS
jgi:hypothetical protein